MHHDWSVDICLGIHHILHNLMPIKLLSCSSALVLVSRNLVWPIWVVFAGNELFTDFAAAFLECKIWGWLVSNLISFLLAKESQIDKLEKGKALAPTVLSFAVTVRSDAWFLILEAKYDTVSQSSVGKIVCVLAFPSKRLSSPWQIKQRNRYRCASQTPGFHKPHKYSMCSHSSTCPALFRWTDRSK